MDETTDRFFPDATDIQRRKRQKLRVHLATCRERDPKLDQAVREWQQQSHAAMMATVKRDELDVFRILELISNSVSWAIASAMMLGASLAWVLPVWTALPIAAVVLGASRWYFQAKLRRMKQE